MYMFTKYINSVKGYNELQFITDYLTHWLFNYCLLHPSIHSVSACFLGLTLFDLQVRPVIKTLDLTFPDSWLTFAAFWVLGWSCQLAITLIHIHITK